VATDLVSFDPIEPVDHVAIGRSHDSVAADQYSGVSDGGSRAVPARVRAVFISFENSLLDVIETNAPARKQASPGCLDAF
jgi:hypothetical protein